MRTAVLASRVRVTWSVVRIDLSDCLDIQNLILPLTQSTNGLWQVSQLYLRTVVNQGYQEIYVKDFSSQKLDLEYDFRFYDSCGGAIEEAE